MLPTMSLALIRDKWAIFWNNRTLGSILLLTIIELITFPPVVPYNYNI